MYSGPIIDPHHHLWDLSLGAHPWLSTTDPALADLTDIARDYLVADYVGDSRGHDIVATVHVEALWAGDPVGETRWLETLDKSRGVATRYVGAAPFGRPEAAGVIAEQAAFARVTGLRAILSHHPDARKSFVADPELGRNPDWRRDVALLAGRGLNLELMMYPYQAEIVREIAEANPRLQIVVNHCGSPIDRDAEGLRRWRDGLAMIAARPNVALKISNLGAYDPQWTLDSLREVVRRCLACFGPERCMFATDYPVARLQMSYDQIYAAFKSIAAALPADEQAALFYGNAKRLYRFD